MQPQVFVLNQGTENERREQARYNNIRASKTVADVIRTTLGPRAMLKMIIDPMGSLAITNDGNAILRELDVSHPAAKTMLEVARAQDEQIGDGTTSVVVLAGEVIALAEPLLRGGLHPIKVTQGYQEALDFIVKEAEAATFKLDPSRREDILCVVQNAIRTKYAHRWLDLMCTMAYDAVSIVARSKFVDGAPDIDIKRFCRVEKIPGATVQDSRVIDGVVLNKDIIHPEMRRTIKNPRVVLLDCPLEYKKAQSMMNIELGVNNDLESVLKAEEDYVKAQVNHILKFNPDLVITEKGIADHATHLFVRAGVTVLRRVRKTDNVRLAAVTGATIVSRVEELVEKDVGTHAGLYELQKIGDEFFSFVYDCGDKARACTLLLRGASKATLLEVERNILDALHICRNILLNPTLVAGGGAFEMRLATAVAAAADRLVGQEASAFRAISTALEVIPRTLLQNCGGNVIRGVTELRAAHAAALSQGEPCFLGVDGTTGLLVDNKEARLWDPYETRLQILKLAIENACMVIRVDDIFSCTGQGV
ncbi:TCP-1 chaperonin subunit gamma [Giardia muris]|uniref:T-complex protein 1 subunit gamma n=1 Tax=Giardia muris TaxID=5742 RepID=A0A4Z1TB74_GIAMU|nr:TCP-1 chaperonin subunit gamma [Giardia muris]|eukprot:TNJ29781.1 TCP-1 chaperonin subunit gamma [Giardia muris]